MNKGIDIFRKYSPELGGSANQAAIHAHGSVPVNNIHVALDKQTSIQYLAEPGMQHLEAVGAGGFEYSLRPNFMHNKNLASPCGVHVTNYHLKSLYYRDEMVPLWKKAKIAIVGETNSNRFLWDQVSPQFKRGVNAAGTLQDLDVYYQCIANFSGKDIYVVMKDTDFSTLYEFMKERCYSIIYAVHCRGNVDPRATGARLMVDNVNIHTPWR
ncbi:hypothetical protein [Pantoea sp. SS70]|uniref:hypothetical protein n=1 Tax=Pantoea sp. SS70 TaxID=3024247 RepID=UPI002452C5A5|nr:hypothetical protein [Pantoea sp. SS70]